MLISIDESDPRPMYAQIAASVKDQIREGSLKPGDELPGVRELSESLGINLHTVHQAYRTLKEQGVINMRLGQRARIAPLREKPADRAQAEAALAGRLRELFTEAFHQGLSTDDFRRLVGETLREGKEGAGSR